MCPECGPPWQSLQAVLLTFDSRPQSLATFGERTRHCHSLRRRKTVAQVSKPAVSPISKSAARATLCAGPVWKPAIQQARRPALRCCGTLYPLTEWQWRVRSPEPCLGEDLGILFCDG